MSLPDAIRTERVVLRRPGVADARDVFEGYAQDPRVTEYLTWRPHRSIRETEAFLREAELAWLGSEKRSYALVRAEGGPVIGMLDVRMRPEELSVELGYVLRRADWGQGLMTEVVRAVSDLLLGEAGVVRVLAHCDIENAASCRVLEKAGFACEGRIPRLCPMPNICEQPRDAWRWVRARPVNPARA